MASLEPGWRPLADAERGTRRRRSDLAGARRPCRALRGHPDVGRRGASRTQSDPCGRLLSASRPSPAWNSVVFDGTGRLPAGQVPSPPRPSESYDGAASLGPRHGTSWLLSDLGGVPLAGCQTRRGCPRKVLSPKDRKSERSQIRSVTSTYGYKSENSMYILQDY